MLDRKDHTPAYIRIRDDLLKDITEGRFKTGDKIPSENKLAEQFKVSRITARHAVTELVNGGYIYRLHGKGTFVSKPMTETSDLYCLSLYERMNMKGFTLISRVLSLSLVSAGADIREILDLNQDDKVYILKRLRFLHGKPMVLQESVISEKHSPDLMKFDWERESLYNIVTEYCRLKIGGVSESLEALNGSDDINALLEIDDNTPILYSERITKLSNGSPLEYAKSWYRGDKYQFNIEI